ncbi:hypothetical protein B0H11DRAFT_834279 [Mycena galericulata]|nr:hypothetical protein B0H11DRAFT_834279 [Mycena galericulata]
MKERKGDSAAVVFMCVDSYRRPGSKEARARASRKAYAVTLGAGNVALEKQVRLGASLIRTTTIVFVDGSASDVLDGFGPGLRKVWSSYRTGLSTPSLLTYFLLLALGLRRLLLRRWPTLSEAVFDGTRHTTLGARAFSNRPRRHSGLCPKRPKTKLLGVSRIQLPNRPHLLAHLAGRHPTCSIRRDLSHTGACCCFTRVDIKNDRHPAPYRMP